MQQANPDAGDPNSSDSDGNAIWMIRGDRHAQISSTNSQALSADGENRLFMLMFDPETGAVAMDNALLDQQGRPGFDLSNRRWPHGWMGTAQAHRVVFSR